MCSILPKYGKTDVLQVFVFSSLVVFAMCSILAKNGKTHVLQVFVFHYQLYLQSVKFLPNMVKQMCCMF